MKPKRCVCFCRRRARGPSIQRVPDDRWAIYPRDFVHVYHYGQKVGEGTVIKCVRKRNQVWVSGVNVQSTEKLDRSDPQNIVTRTITEEAPVHYSNVNLVDPVDGKRAQRLALNARLLYVDTASHAVYRRAPQRGS